MSDTSIMKSPSRISVSYLLSLYTRTTLWYLLFVALFAAVGIESIYMSPTPFHALLFPASETWGGPVLVIGLMGVAGVALTRYASPGRALAPHRKALIAGCAFLWVALLTGILAKNPNLQNGTQTMWAALWDGARWHFPFLVVSVGGAAFGIYWLKGHPAFCDETHVSSTRRAVIAIAAFSILFSISVAMIRGGTDGITDAYHRQTYEYIGDIGSRSSIRAFLHDYNDLHDYLSMHAKVHPPGPVVMLWLMSTVLLTTSPLVLSVATIVVGSTAVIPLFLWVRDMVHARAAFVCSLLYVLVPAIVLFTATSADILFMPLTLWCLFFFWRAIHRNSWKCALAAGVLYALMSLCSFSLLAIGAFFGFVGLWRLSDRALWIPVVRTAALMIAGFLAIHLAIRYWSGFDIIECFRLSKAQFAEDQANLDIYAPRYPGWTFRFLNPMALFFFAGIPVSVLFCWRLWRPEPGTRRLFHLFALTLIALNLLYLGRGEGERSAMYIFPFVVIPAAHLLDEFSRRTRSNGPLIATLVFLAIQCWATETCLYTYW